jgi:hypothetical protein
MKITEFERLPEEPEKIEVGQIFLSKKLEEQKSTKVVGQTITYYIITRVVSQKHYEYVPKYEVLEEGEKPIK